MAKRIVDEEMRFSIVVNGNEAQKELLDLEKANRKLLDTNRKNRTEQRKLERQGKQNTARYKELSAEIARNTTELQKNYTRMNKLEEEIGVTGLSVTQLTRKLKALRVAWNNSTPGTEQYKMYEKQIAAVNQQLSTLRMRSRGAKAGIKSLADGFNRYAALGASVIAVLTGVVFKLQQMIDFNAKLADAQSDVQKTTGMNKREVEDLAKSFGLLQTRTNRINLLKIAEEGGRIGIAKDEIADFVAVMDKAVVALSDSFPGGVEETASKLGKLKTLFKETRELGVDEAYNSIGSAINDLGAEGVASESNIAEFATRVGSLPDALKPTVAEALALGAGFEESGIQAEIAGRAYNIFLKQAAEDGEKFGKVMGISAKAVEDLINTNPLEFMLQFSRSLDGMNATETAQTLDYLGISADGANKVVGALSNNTERFRELLELSNDSMEKGTSLTNEYNIKNNNLAATLEKVGKFFRGAFANDYVTGSLNALVTGFAKMVGIIKSVNKEFREQSKISFETAKANREVATSSTRLLEEYQKLTKEGLEPTKEEKERLDIITLQLRDHLGESVMMIDEETGAYKLNTEAVREQIKIKRLAADEEASTLASRLVGVKEEQKRLAIQQRDAQKEFELRKKIYLEQDIAERKSGQVRDDYLAARQKVSAINDDIAEQLNREADLTEKLAELNFSAADAQSFIEPNQDAPEPSEPQEGDTKRIGGVLYRYTGGKWVAQFVPTGGDTDDQAQKNADALRKLYGQERELENSLIQDNFEREMEQLEENHRQKIEDLKAQLVTEGQLSEEQIAINGSIRRQIKLQEEKFQLDKGAIIEKGYQDDIALMEEAYKKAQAYRDVKHQEELNAVGDNEKAKERLKEKHRQEDLEAEQAHVKEVIQALKFITENGQFEGFDLSLLSNEEAARLQDLIDQLVLKLNELKNAKDDVEGKGLGGYTLEDATENVDIFGMTASQWEQTLDNLDQAGYKFEAIRGATNAAMSLYQEYSNLMSAKEAKQAQEFEQKQTEEERILKQKLDSRLISQKQYDAAIAASEAELEKKKAELAVKQAKRDRAMALANIALNTAQAIMSIWAQVPKVDFGVTAGILTGFVTALGALQAATVLATPLPVKGYQDGLYNVTREQDGKPFKARFGGESRSGLVDFPTVFMAGEEGKTRPEMIINGQDYANFSESFKDSLYRELGRVKGYADGYYQSSTTQPSFNAGDSTAAGKDYLLFAAALNRNSEIMERLERDGLVAYLKRDYENARKMKEDIADYDRLRNKNQF